MSGYTSNWEVDYPYTTDDISSLVFNQAANAVENGLNAVDRVSMICLKPNNDSTGITAKSTRIHLANEGSVSTVKNGAGVSYYSGSIRIPPNYNVLLFATLDANQMNNGQNCVLEIHVGTSYNDVDISPAVTYTIQPAGGSGYVALACAPLFIPWTSSTRYAFIATRSTGGGGTIQQNGTALAAIAIRKG